MFLQPCQATRLGPKIKIRTTLFQKQVQLGFRYSSTALVSRRPWLETVEKEKYTTVNEKLHHSIVAFTSWIQPTPAETAIRSALFEAVAQAIGGLPTSRAGDLDIVVTTRQNSTPRDHKKLAFQVEKYLKTSGIVTKLTVNHWAPVPVVHCESTAAWGNIPIDISFEPATATRSASKGTLVASALQSHMKAQPALVPLVLTIKAFLRQRDLGSAKSGGLGSYPLSVMVTSFLQRNPMALASDFISSPFEKHTLGHLLTQFFLHYGNAFPYGEKCISIEPINGHDALASPSSTAPVATVPATTTDSVTEHPASSGASTDIAEDTSTAVIPEKAEDHSAVAQPEQVQEKISAVDISEKVEGHSVIVQPEQVQEKGLKSLTGLSWIKPSLNPKVAIECLVEPKYDIGKGTARMSKVAEEFKMAAETLLQVQSPEVDVLGTIITLSKETITHRAYIETIKDTYGTKQEATKQEAEGDLRSAWNAYKTNLEKIHRLLEDNKKLHVDLDAFINKYKVPKEMVKSGDLSIQPQEFGDLTTRTPRIPKPRGFGVSVGHFPREFKKGVKDVREMFNRVVHPLSTPYLLFKYGYYVLNHPSREEAEAYMEQWKKNFSSLDHPLPQYGKWEGDKGLDHTPVGNDVDVDVNSQQTAPPS
ncbi:hypothetical protein BDP27DRAFT_1365519 [Rhodocollybia butyracea]|uniref:Polynucleotide adenylyltransferase n=1 Tax=Rhodocollybia butyracea TaxID=206335 RepID=A0A9P5U563_9AGAR|nr:hypothetical protein BDP27DRAFT_1365519 [Rhodocollybia butyracea]